MATTENELKELIDKAVEKMLGGEPKELLKALNEIRAWGEDGGEGKEAGRIKQAEDAIKQLEEQRKSLEATIDGKIAQAARRAYDAQGNYRGHFASEDQARTYALVVLSKTGEHEDRKKWLDVMEADHKTFAQQHKDVAGDQALIPHEHSTRIHRLVEDSSVWAGHVFRMPMGSSDLSFTRRVSGFRARKTKIRTAVGKQNMAVAPVNLTAASFDILTSYPKELEADALVVVAELLLMEMSLGFSIALEEDGLIGDGTDAYDNEMGILTLLKDINGTDDGGGLVLASGAAGTGWGGIAKDDILKLLGTPRNVRPGGTKAVCSNEFFWQVLAKIITDAGGRTMMESQSGLSLNIFGVPVEISHVMPRSSGNSQVPLIIGDLYQSSTLGDRQQYTVQTSREVYFESKEVGVLGSARYAINNHSLGDAATPGPVAGLITAVSN